MINRLRARGIGARKQHAIAAMLREMRNAASADPRYAKRRSHATLDPNALERGLQRRASRASDGKAAADIGFDHLRACSADDDLPAVHDGKTVGQVARKLEILLDQQNGHLPLLPQVDDGAADVLDDRRLDALGRLVEHQQAAGGSPAPGRSPVAAAGRRTDHRRAGAAWSRAPGNSSKTSSWTPPLAPFQQRKAGLQVLLDREQRKDLAALRHEGDAAACALVRGKPADILAVPDDTAGEMR